MAPRISIIVYRPGINVSIITYYYSSNPDSRLFSRSRSKLIQLVVVPPYIVCRLLL